MANKYLTLLSGTTLVPDTTQTLILPDDHTDVKVGDYVMLNDELGKTVGTGIVERLEVRPFSLLQQYHFDGTAHSALTSWGVAADALKELVPGFRITDPTTVVWVRVEALRPTSTEEVDEEDEK